MGMVMIYLKRPRPFRGSNGFLILMTDTDYNLDQLPPGSLASIQGLSVDVDLRARLTALGLAAGKQVRVLRRAGLSGPLHVRAGTTEIILRRSEASKIQVLLPQALAA
jgi:ferrous iron transport protein A